MNTSPLKPGQDPRWMVPCFKVQDIVENIDERSFFAEIYRDDARLPRATTNGDVVYRLTA